MLDASNKTGLEVATAVTRSVLEIRSWSAEHRSGEQTLRLDGRELPREVGATLPGPLHILCLAPGEWALICDEQSASSILERVAPELAAQGAVIVDVTDGVGTLNVRGPWARDVLSKGCGLDFHPRAFLVGYCARTRFAQLPVVVDHIDDTPTFRLYVPRSYLAFLADWIADATVEFNSSTV